ncbi:MAG: carboxylating nicotinate-nucleotide diphosphorylase [Bacteriovoracaceae bacterium]|jgi:nicotinate-nucleotide pyrophosphorylase (carboxylating)|nr:nicotinate-nucleotide diphosphorylase (carboxylating) [Halobacteriovoraceae bacterium]MDP7321433.1 carboxylating nicotinate-nucleotide diphosphorylase [Bacteriovoracaceae bacterium]
MNLQSGLRKSLEYYFSEDELAQNFFYTHSLPQDLVECQLKIKDDMVLSGLPFFFETFNYLTQNPFDYSEFLFWEGKKILKQDSREIKFQLPFNIALSGERIALNLLQKSSSISTYTQRFVEKAGNIKILDTRKTTPGLRFLEKYAVNKGGGFNHRFSQTDAWMIKDNHKKFWHGLKPAVEHFRGLHTFYTPLIVEIHDLEELNEAISLGIKHFLLDNFSPVEVKKALELKDATMTYEVSGGINLESLEDYLFEGVDAISCGSITYNAPQVDLSMKIERLV